MSIADGFKFGIGFLGALALAALVVVMLMAGGAG
jgi:hypothetical protein